MEYLLESHTAIFTGPTNCGKTEHALRLLETEYRFHFDFIVIICPTLKYNETYRTRTWFWQDPFIILIDHYENLHETVHSFSTMLNNWKTLFLIDDIIADESLDKKRSGLLELCASGRHKEHSLWILTQSYTAIPKNIRRQLKMLYIWYPKDRKDLILINDENDVIESNNELSEIKNKLKSSKHACLTLRMEYPRSYEVI